MRCAIYTRKSSDEAAESHLGSTTVQRELCEAYITSQTGEGWTCLPDPYDDIGWSGGTLARPALKQLRADIVAGRVDVVVVYKIDRLSRSLKDFLDLVEEMDKAGVTFVSITQAFNTTTPMGRLMLNVLLSFAQFERELTGERLRDWFAGARARGIWTHPRPFGYRRGEDGRLVVVEDEAEVVRMAYRLYCKLGSSRLVANELNLAGHRNKFGRPWAGHATVVMLTNRLYIGDRVHKGVAEPGQHVPIISQALWRKAQQRMEVSRRRREGMKRDPEESLLRGRIKHELGRALIHVTARGRTGDHYRYYVPHRERYGPGARPEHRFRARALEDAVLIALGPIIGRDLDTLAHAARLRVIQKWVEMVTIGDTDMVISLYSGGEIIAPHKSALLIKPRPWPRGTMPPWLRQCQAMMATGVSLNRTAKAHGVSAATLSRANRAYPRPSSSP